MVNVTSTNRAAEKFSRKAGQAQQDYETGVSESSDSEWQDGTLSAESSWESGIQDAISNGSFSAGVRNTPKSWQAQTTSVGPRRFSEGVQQAQGTYEQAVQPYFQALENLDLAPRGARGDPGNYDRVQQVGQTLHEVRSNR